MKDIYYAVAHRSQAEINSFKDRYQKFDTTLIPEIFKNSLGLTVSGFKPSDSWGSSHVIYFVEVNEQKEPLVLRANTGFLKEPEVVMKTEKLITDRVSNLGIPTNIILYVNISRSAYPFDFQIQKLLIGEDPEVAFHGSQADYDHISFELGATVGKYSQLNFPGFGRFAEPAVFKGRLNGSKAAFYDYLVVCLEADLKFLTDGGTLTVVTATQIRKIFDEYRSVTEISRGSLVHHDLADHNIRFSGRHLTGVFDWEAALSGDPILDLASCPTWKTIYPREPSLLAGYQSVCALPDNFKEKMDIYRLRTMIWKIVYAQRMKILTPDRLAKFNDSLQLFRLRL